MAQVDFFNYFSILFWFIILFILYYIINYALLVPLLHTNFISRVNMLDKGFNLMLRFFCNSLSYNMYIYKQSILYIINSLNKYILYLIK